MRRYFAQALVLIYGFSNVVSLYSAETNYWEERRRTGQRRGSAAILATTQGLRAAEVVAAGPTGDSPSSLAELAAGPSHRVLSPGMQKDWGWLPDLVAGYGDIREIHVAPRADAPVVIHLQDVHEVEEAQNNLAGLVESLRAQRGISLVGLEGALGSFELDFFREGPLDVRKKLSDRFLNLGYLTGPEVAGIVAEEKPTLWGLEDLALYRGHVDAFEKSESGRAHVRQSLAGFSAAADKARETFYSPSLRALDDHRRAYMSHKESLGDYVPALWSALAGDKKAYPQVAMLVKLLAQERTLDFKEVERQRVRLAEALAQRLEPNDLDRLVKVSLTYRAGRQTAGTYQKYVATVCRQNDIRLDTFGPLAAYMDYVQGADPLDSGKLLDELDRLELAALTGLAETSKEKKLVDVFRGLALLDKLTNHGLTPQEWRVLKKEDLSLENIRSVLTQISPTFGSNTVSLPDLSPYKEYCLKAEQRNNALVKNLLAKMKTDKVNLSVLVAGGFHTDGMMALLKEANASYVVITPKISKVPDTRPLDIFVRAPLPLEKLLAGDVIHLAYPRLTQNNLETIGAAPNAPKRRDTLFKAWLLSLKNGKEKDGKSTTGLVKGVRSALTVVPLTGLLKEIRFFVPSVLGVLAGEFLTSTLGLTGGPIVHVLVGLTAAILYWPKFRDHHGSAESRWLDENPGTTSSDYRRNLFIAYGLISLVTVGAMVLVPALGVWLVEAQGPITLFEETGRAVGSIVVGGLLFHGIYNFVGRLFGGSRFVPAMADIRDSENDQKRDLDWCENQIRPNQFNAYSALMGSVIESLLKSDEGKKELVEKVPRLLAKLMDLVRENSYFEILPALKMMERLMEVSVQLDLQNGQSVEDLLRPSLTEILYRELSSPLYSDAHLIALLRFSLRVGVDPALCSRVTVQRLVASDWFVDRFLTEIRTGGIEQAEAESLLGVTANVDGEPNPGGPDSSLESREAQEKISQVLAVVQGEKEWERPVNEFRQATDPDVRRVIAQRLERLFHNALDLLRAVHRDEQSVVEALAQLVPSLSRLSPTGFSNSLFITTGFLSSLVNNLSSMGSLLGRDITDEWDDLSKMRPVVPIGSGQSQVEILGYSFPAILASWMKEESLAVNPAPKSRSEFAVISADESKPLDHQFQELVAARKRLLAIDERGRARFASLAGGAVTRADAESLLVIVGKMVDAFNRLGEKNGLPNSTLPPVWERLEQTIQDGIGSLRPEDVVSSQIQHLILDLPRPAVQWEEVGTLHQALNFMHQKGKQLFAEAAGLARVNTIVKVGHVAVTVANLSGNPIESNGVFVNRELRQVLRALEKPGSGPTAEVVLDNKFLKGSVALGVHSVEFLASIAPPENGGGIKVSFLEWRPKEGNIMRLAFIQAVLTKLGFKTEVRNEMFLNGTLDIQSGAFSQEQIEKALYLLVRVLYFTPDLNLMFDHVIGAKCKENGMDRAEAYAATQGEFSDLADVFLAEESIPFFLMDDPQYAQRLDHAYQTYKAKEPERNRVRKLLNNRLVRCGLSPIPETIPFGQGVIQSYYTEPLMSALAKGEIRVEAEGPVRNRNYRPIEDLARESLDRGDELMRMAAGLNGLMADLAFHPIGAVGELIAEECILIVGSGDRLVVRGLADPDSRQLVYATASLLKGDQRVRRLTLEDLGELLNAPEITQGLGEALRRSRKSISEKRLRGKPQEETMPGLVHRGRPISSGTGSVVGVATFDRTFQEKAGARADHVLVVDFTTPSDFDAMKGSLATLTTLGNPESHSAITLRELHHCGVIFRGARWVTRNGKRALSVPVDRPHKPFQGEQGLWITPGVDVQDHLVEEGSVLLIDGERGVVSMLSGGWVEAVYTKWRDFKENRASAQEVVSFVRSFNNWDVLELFLFLAVFNDGLEETQRARVIALLEESVADSSADDRDRFSEAKIKYLQLAVEKTDKDLAWLAEKFRGASTFNHIAASFKQIQNKILSLEGLANLLSLVAPRSADLSDFNSEIKTKEKKLRDQSLKELSKWDRKKATIADLPAIRFVLRRSQLNGVPLNNKSFQRLVKKERALTDDKRNQIRKEKAWVYALDKVDRDFTKEVGGKFSNLGESEPLIRQEGAFVPRALGVTSHAFDSFLVEQGIHLEYHELASELDGFYESDSTRDSEFYGQVQAVSQEMRDAIESHSIDENGNLGKRLRMDLESAGLGNAALILRSSGDMEDNNIAAFAGGARSFSNVNRINLLQMIPKVWASFWLSRGVAYRAHKKMKQKDARLAVIIQELIRGEMSGVMMTANPNSGEDSIVITAGYGLNEGIENNQVECDEYVVRKSDGELIANPTIPQKQKKVVANPTGEGTILVDVPPEDQKRQVLSADQIKWLVRVGNALQTHYGHPRNVEYTFVGGKLAILQDRAITTINEGLSPRGGKESKQRQSRWGSLISLLVLIITFGVFNFHKDANAIESLNSSPGEEASQLVKTDQGLSENSQQEELNADQNGDSPSPALFI